MKRSELVLGARETSLESSRAARSAGNVGDALVEFPGKRVSHHYTPLSRDDENQSGVTTAVRSRRTVCPISVTLSGTEPSDVR